MGEQLNTLGPVLGVKGIFEHKGTYLLARHNNQLPVNKGKWTFLGGAGEAKNFSLEATLKRELYEELHVGIYITGHVGVFLYNKRTYLILAARLRGEPIINSSEILKI